jgi:hypothetical protein
MSFEHINFKKKTYFIHERKLKSGKISYSCSKNSVDALDQIPEGHELYENPNGQVFCRKPPEKLITDEEVDLVRDLIRKHCSSFKLKIDVKKNIISIWEPDGMIQSIYSTYSPTMRYVLRDKKSRNFTAERFCYLGSIDDWRPLYSLEGNTLAEIVKETIVHIGHESFYDLG